MKESAEAKCSGWLAECQRMIERATEPQKKGIRNSPKRRRAAFRMTGTAIIAAEHTTGVGLTSQPPGPAVALHSGRPLLPDVRPHAFVRRIVQPALSYHPLYALLVFFGSQPVLFQVINLGLISHPITRFLSLWRLRLGYALLSMTSPRGLFCAWAEVLQRQKRREPASFILPARA